MNPVTDNNQDESGMAGMESTVSKDTIDLLRRFHFGEPAAAERTEKPASAILPALLNAYRDAAAIRYQYPLYLAPPGDASDEKLAKSVSEHFSDSLQAIAPEADDARILKDNVAWIERFLRQKLDAQDSVDANALFDDAAAALQKHLDLDQASREQLDAQLERLKATIAKDARFLGYGPSVSLHLMVHAIRHRRERGREKFRDVVEQHIHGLQSLLAVAECLS